MYIKELKKFKEVIEKYKIQAQVLLDVINHPETTDIEREKASACRRFVINFICDLRKIK